MGGLCLLFIENICKYCRKETGNGRFQQDKEKTINDIINLRLSKSKGYCMEYLIGQKK